jgi:hypothetical protein
LQRKPPDDIKGWELEQGTAMSNNVVTLQRTEYEPPDPQGTAQEYVIQTLENLLERAKNGEIAAIGVAVVSHEGNVEQHWCTRQSTEWKMLQAMERLTNGYVRAKQR